MEIRVMDTGTGIGPEDQSKLFEAFSQVHMSAARRHEGTGLGLHLSQKLAELLRSRMSLLASYGQVLPSQ